MEILDYNYTSKIMNIGIALSLMTILLIIITTVIHWIAERRRHHTLVFDQMHEPMVMNYLEGRVPRYTVIGSMAEESSEAMDLLMELSRKLQPSAQSRLLRLFSGLPGVEEEINAIDSPHAKRRLQAAERLAFVKNETSAEALLRALEDESVAVRYCAARSLAAHARPEFIEPTLLAFDADHEINWFRLVEVVHDYGSVAVPTLLRMLKDPQWAQSTNILNVVIRALGMLEAQQAVRPLMDLLHHPDMSVRHHAARALGDIGDPAAILSVTELSHDPEADVRRKAVEAIGKLRAETQIPVLEQALGDPSWWVRLAAAEALYAIGPAGIERLKEVRRDTHDIYVHDICSQVLSEHDVHNSNGKPS